MAGETLRITCPKVHPSIAASYDTRKGPKPKGMDEMITLEYTLPNSLDASTWLRMITAAVKSAGEAKAGKAPGPAPEAEAKPLVELKAAAAAPANEVEIRAVTINAGWCMPRPSASSIAHR